MPSHRHYDYSFLPERIQRQLGRSAADAGSHLADETSNARFYALHGLGVAFVLLLWVAALASDFGTPEKDELWSDLGRMFWYAILLGALGWLGASIYQRFSLNKRFGFAPGQYLFPFTLVDARKGRLQVVDLTELKGVEATEHRVNGFYSHTMFVFTFHDASPRKWKISGKKKAEAFGDKFNALQAQARSAFDRNDVATLLRLDPFFEIRRKNWEGQGAAPARTPKQRLVEPVFAALAAAIVVAPLAWAVRTAAADVSMRAQAQELKTEAAYRHYINYGKFFVGKMTLEIPRVAFEEVRAKKSVAALRALLARYPEQGLAADVSADIHTLYQSALERFAAQAATADAALLAAMGQMLEILEKRGDPKVGIRFNRPSTDALAELDERLRTRGAKQNGVTIIPAAEHFGPDSAATREARVVAMLKGGFARIFPNDVLELQAAAAGDTRLPVLVIDYQIAPSGALYTLEGGDRGFVGLVARFQAALQVKPNGQPWRFDMEVEPPDTFQVQHSNADGKTESSAGEVYSVMAERAFDSLSAKMRGAFFRQGSEAFKKMEGANAAK